MILLCVGITYEYTIIMRYHEIKIKFFITVISYNNKSQLLIGYFHSTSQYRNNIYKLNIINIIHIFSFHKDIRR